MRKLCFALSAAAVLAGLCMTAEAGSVLPSVMESYEKNADNSYSVSYLEEDPYLVNIYEGYGFAKDYGSARGHAYVLEDVGKTERPHALANCLTCKTADFTKLVNDLGEDAYSLEFESLFPDMHENVGCYSCLALYEPAKWHNNSNRIIITMVKTVNFMVSSEKNRAILFIWGAAVSTKRSI